MAAPNAIAEELRRTIRLQAQASDPAASAWVSANAGTGKTHVLTTRVLRLLLAGTPPDRILCLTYTKAAAAEMSQRVFQRLAGWVTLSDEMLGQILAQLLDRPASVEELPRARQLFAQAIETPGGFKVQTIHAFCERLLQRFPLEAEVPPNFAILDEETGRALQRQAIDEVLAEAARNPGGEIGRALERAVAYAVDDRFDDLLRDTLAKRDWLDAAIRLDPEAGGDFASAEAFYRRAFSIGAKTTLGDLDASLAALLSDEHLRRAQDVLGSGSARDLEVSVRIAAVRTASSAAQRFDALCDLFLTGRGEPRKSLVTNGLATAHPDIAAVLGRAQDRFLPLQTERGHLAVVESTLALLRLGHAVTQRYSLLKARRAALDFDDLIRKAALLLSDHASAEWVLYKLDGGLDHILVDEAQDTSSTQWNVIEALAKEFFSGAGAREDVVRTLFAVGDEKQSIYGFQGARPEMFAGVGKRIAMLAQASEMEWRHVPLTLSFRSVQPVLSAVDAIFADRSKMPGISAPSAIVRHIAMRTGHAGLVEMWDTEKSDDVEPTSVWSPLDDEPASSPVVRLAARIAETIKHWLDTGELLASENRPVRAGDILILVRKRRPFADAVVAALKVRGVPVAGADRIALADQIAIQDLMAVGDFILLPEDDLVLATLLKSPFFDLEDDDLLAVAPGRKGSLWSALLAAAEARPAFKRAAETLKRWRARADFAPPFEFYAEILDRDGGRACLLERLGPEAADPIDEFLDLALKYDDGAAPSLQGFLDWMRANDITIKRDMEHGRGEVRVMTVHGAKGLEAPIVVLPDTCTARSGERPGGLLALPDAARQPHVPEPFCWPVKGTSRLSGVQAARQAAQTREAEERNRLLYVALTRARDRLYVAGFEGANGRDRSCWYNQIDEALTGVLSSARDWQDRPVRLLEARQEAEPERIKASPVDRLAAQSLPEWAVRPAPRERDLVLPLAPSRLAPLETDADGDPVDVPRSKQQLAEPPSPGPAILAEGNRFLRGTITHALLQYLPELDARTWDAAAKRFVAARGAGLSERTRAGIVAETLAVLRDPSFAPLFGPESLSEVPIVAEIQPPGGIGHRFRLAGQIDRLVRLGHEVLIVDYKTNRPPPLHVKDVADTYTLQLAAYRLAVGQIFGSVTVKAALLWTDGPRIMEIPSAVLDAAQARLFTLDRASLDAGGGGT